MAYLLKNSEQIIIGVNWGGEKTKGWFGATEYVIADLDLHIIALNNNDFNQNNEIPVNRIISCDFNNTPQNGINIEKDDTKGDLKGNDNKDNEWAILNQPELQTDNILIPVIYNYNDLKWEGLSHLEFRVYTGGPNEVKNLINFQDLKKGQFEDGEILIPGKIFNKNNNWYFDTCSNNEKIELLLKIKNLGQNFNPF